MNIQRGIRKVYWYLSARYYAMKYPVNQNSSVFFGITGTDGKTTTSSFIYELAKSQGYSPLLLTTVSARFNDADIPVKLKSTSFFAYSIKNALSGLKQFDLKVFFKNLFFLDTEGFESIEEEHRTTPLASEIRKLIREYQSKGANFFILETTSHAINQCRVFGIKFDSVAYTNITNDHLDYHGTFEHYANTKLKLINQLKQNSFVAINKDDPKSYPLLVDVVSKKNQTKLEYSMNPLSVNDITIQKFFICIDTSKHELVASHSPLQKTLNLETSIQLFGLYNIYNALAAFTCFYGFLLKEKKDISKENLQVLASSLSKLEDIKGRMNFVHTDPTVIVDFAHTPNGTEQALRSARKLKEQNGNDSKLWVLLGCAGFRDHYKRPVVGKTAFEYADRFLITADDPRTEKLSDINDQIVSGFKDTAVPHTLVTYTKNLSYPPEIEKLIVRFDEQSINARKDAIAFALKNASKNDVVVLLGKGHESTISFGDEELAWDEAGEVKKFFN